MADDRPAPNHRVSELLPYRLSRREVDFYADHFLDLNECTLEHAPGFVSYITECVLHLRPERYPLDMGLRASLLESLARFLGVAPSHLLLTPGSDHGLRMLLQAYTHEDRDVWVPVPNYERVVSFIEREPHRKLYRLPVPDGDDEACARIIENALEEATDKPSVVYLSRPNNPLGYTVASDAVRRWAAAYPGTLFIVDEAYIEWGADGDDVASLASCVPGTPNIVVTRTFSKCFGLAGLRVGYVVACEDVIRHLARLQDDKDVTELAQRAALWVTKRADFYIDRAQRLRRECVNLFRMMQRFDDGDAIRDARVRGGMFAVIRTRCDPGDLVSWLRTHGILVRSKHAEVAGVVRVTLAPVPVMQRLLSLCVEWNNRHRRWCSIVPSRLPRETLVLVDLDDTVRHGSHVSGYRAQWTAALGRLIASYPRLRILTNNTSESPDSIAQSLSVPVDCILTPLDALRLRFPMSAFRGLYVVGQPSTAARVRDHGYRVVDGADLDAGHPCDALLFANSYCMGTTSWYDVGRILRRCPECTVLFAEWEVTVTANGCPDLPQAPSSGADATTLLPDMCPVWHWVSSVHDTRRTKPILLGKPEPTLARHLQREGPATVVIGNSVRSDLGLSRALNGSVVSILVDPSADVFGYRGCLDACVVHDFEEAVNVLVDAPIHI